MVHLDVKIQTLEMAKNGEGVVPNSLEDITEAKSMTVGILEGGMQSGATSIMFCLDMPDGTVAMSQCSAKQLRALAKVLEGAEQRFKKLRGQG